MQKHIYQSNHLESTQRSQKSNMVCLGQQEFLFGENMCCKEPATSRADFINNFINNYLFSCVQWLAEIREISVLLRNPRGAGKQLANKENGRCYCKGSSSRGSWHAQQSLRAKVIIFSCIFSKEISESCFYFSPLILQSSKCFLICQTLHSFNLTSILCLFQYP